jgi:uncharacterized Tic20 family protein
MDDHFPQPGDADPNHPYAASHVDPLPGDGNSIVWDKDAQNWALFCHLASLLQLVGPTAGNIIGPLIVWLIKRDQYPLVDDQGKESLNFQISITLYTWGIGAALAATCVGLFLVPFVVLGLLIVDVVYVILACIKVSGGEVYRYPLTIRFLK